MWENAGRQLIEKLRLKFCPIEGFMPAKLVVDNLNIVRLTRHCTTGIA